MKRLILIAVTLLLLAGMGYFAMQNSHNVSLNLFGNFSIQLSAWMVIVGSFVAGWAVTEIWQFISHPQRFVQSFLGKFSRYRDNKKQKITQIFENASLLRDPKQVKKSFHKLVNQETPLLIRVQYLEQLRYEKNAEELLKKYAELRAKYQGNLQVLLPYLNLACEVSEWDLVERLSHEILRISPDHPDALAGLQQFYIARQDWVACIEQERDLLKKYSGSFITQKISEHHEEHLKQALRQDPKCLHNWSFRYLPQKRDKKNDKPFEALGEAAQLQKSSMFLEAARVLKDAYGQTAFPELLKALEVVYRKSGADQQIMEMIAAIHNSRQRAIPSSLLYAKLLYQNERHDEAAKILAEVKLPTAALKFQIVTLGAKGAVPQMSGEWNDLYHALRYLIAVRQDHTEEALQAAKSLLREAKLLE
ncbi:MAG: hypothetical protein H8E38_11130 [SAR324 cluster bacterium]|nr:hypothetical protein [SAR324 cluster bacterium]MBL7034378.1 hypothetical protein [SAR324 cluster bacterium]